MGAADRVERYEYGTRPRPGSRGQSAVVAPPSAGRRLTWEACYGEQPESSGARAHSRLSARLCGSGHRAGQPCISGRTGVHAGRCSQRRGSGTAAQVVACPADERMLAMSPAKAAPAVRFEATLYTIDGWTILRLPEKASNQLPSRGQVAVQATVNGHACQTVANRTASPATGCGSTRSNSGPLRSAPGTPRRSSSCPSGTGRSQGAT
jgi:Domain of unknown function (DUF1905).